jgi:hypothetical protein
MEAVLLHEEHQPIISAASSQQASANAPETLAECFHLSRDGSVDLARQKACLIRIRRCLLRAPNGQSVAMPSPAMNSRRSGCRPKGPQCCKTGVSLRDRQVRKLTRIENATGMDTGQQLLLPWRRRVRRQALQVRRHSRCTSSVASARSRSYSSFAQRYSMAAFFPSTAPISAMPWRKGYKRRAFVGLSGTAKPPPESLMAWRGKLVWLGAARREMIAIFPTRIKNLV